jgi:PAS domain S-box-containing protein
MSNIQQPWLISLLPPSGTHKRWALAVSTFFLVAFVISFRSAKVILPQSDIYIPLVATGMFLNDLVTASLLLAQFSVVRSRALLLLANGYIFTALVVAVYAVFWWQAFHSTGLFSAGPQILPWLYLIWHAGLPTSVIVYALLKSKEDTTPPVARDSLLVVILVSIACTVLIVCGLTWFFTRFEDILPVLVTPINQASRFSDFGTGAVLFASTSAAVLQWRSRQRSVLDLWLSVVTLAWILGSIMLVAIDVRYDVAWYATPGFSIVSATLVLLVLLSESLTLHAHLAMSAFRNARLRDELDATIVELRHAHEGLELKVEQRRLENTRLYRDLDERDKKISRLVDTNIVGVLVFTLEGQTIEANDALLNMLGYNRDDLISGRLRRKVLTPPDWRAVTDQALAQIAAQGRCDVLEMEYLRKDGSRVPVLVCAAAIEGTKGENVAFVLDLTERKRAEQERERLRQLQAHLAHLNRVSTMGELAASLTHEIKQPIAAARIDASVCMRALADDRLNLEAAREAAARLVKDVMWTDEIIERTTALYKKDTTQREPVNVNAVIREMALLFQQEADALSIAIRTELAEEIAEVHADRVQLQQVFMNLMLNAIDAMKNTGGDLTITLQMREDSELLIAVRDTGVGLPIENPDQIFESFVTTKPHGTGMGLAITRSIVDSHGGRLWAIANSGPGATFLFTLPGGAESISNDPVA